MNHHILRSRIWLSLLLLAALLLPGAAVFADDGSQWVTYEVTLENLTGAQIFSPPVFVSHTGGFKLFRPGKFASDELRLIAEDGNNGPAAALAGSSSAVFAVSALGTPVLPGGSVTIQIEARRGARLSLATMLVQTNDGFTGGDRLKLPRHGSRVYMLNTYDAGTEANNELAAYIPGPPFGGGLRAPTHERIRHHQGILGIGDVDPAVYGWSDPTARLTVTVIDP